MKEKYLITVSRDYWSRTYPGWDNMEPAKQLAIKQKFMKGLEGFLNGSHKSKKMVFGYDGLKISPIVAQPRVRIIRSAGCAYKY